MRLFLGISIPERFHGAIARLQDDLQVGFPVAEENLHLTCLFLGCDVPGNFAQDLHDRLSAMHFSPVEITIGAPSHFGKSKPRAVWLAASPVAPLVQLNGHLTRRANEAGIEVQQRKYVPHVTITRLSSKASDLPFVADHLARNAAFSLPAFMPEAITLFQSHLTRQGPQYEPLEDYYFEKAENPAAQ